jgi:diguanylate cyclase (GGDEF)-like protein/PAS domain S-box-containing protein
MALAAWLVLRSTATLQQSNLWLTRTYGVRTELARTLSRLDGAITHQRDYLMTGASREFASYLASRQEALDGVDRLAAQVTDSPDQANNVRALRAAIHERLRIADESVRIRRDAGFEPARRTVAEGRGTRAMEAAVAALNRVEATEEAILRERTIAWRARTQETTALLLALLGLVGAGAAGSWWLARRDDRRMQAAEQRFRAVADTATDGIATMDVEGRVLYANPVIERMFGYSPGEVLGQRMEALLPERYRERHRAHLEGLRRTGQSDFAGQTMEMSGVRKDGSAFIFEASFAVWREGASTFLTVILRDIDERRRLEAELQRSHTLLQGIIESSPDAMFVKDLEGRYLLINEAGARFLGRAVPEVVGRTDGALFPEAEARGTRERDRHVMETREALHYESASVSADGERYYLTTKVPHVGSDGVVQGIIGISRDITERRRQEQELAQRNAELDAKNASLALLSVTDGLTGLRNHRAFKERLQLEFQISKRHGTPLSLIMLDVDRFKAYNDAFGHQAGDLVLQQIGRILLQEARATDLAARYGGEEFAVILPATDLEGALIVAERIRRAVEISPWDYRPVAVSLGVSSVSGTTQGVNGLIKDADTGLYASKDRGGNRISAYPELFEAVVHAC